MAHRFNYQKNRLTRRWRGARCSDFYKPDRRPTSHMRAVSPQTLSLDTARARLGELQGFRRVDCHSTKHEYLSPGLVAHYAYWISRLIWGPINTQGLQGPIVVKP